MPNNQGFSPNDETKLTSSLQKTYIYTPKRGLGCLLSLGRACWGFRLNSLEGAVSSVKACWVQPL